MTTRTIQQQFKRKESKYILDEKIFAQFKKELSQYMIEDQFANSTISNVYFDNEDFDMIQDALAKRNGREKVRMRIYDAIPSQTSQAFLEIKKKLDDVGYKYRLVSTPTSIAHDVEYFSEKNNIMDTKVSSELQHVVQRYGKLRPKMYIYYDRLSYRGKTDHRIRLTIDQNLVFRDSEVMLLQKKFGFPLLPKQLMIMEIKVPNQLPNWLLNLLEKYQIEQQSFSKYGTAYQLRQEMMKGVSLANRLIF